MQPLVNQLVKTKNSFGDDLTYILEFMYPQYIKKENVFCDYRNDIIYVGQYCPNLREILSKGTHSFIGVCNNGIPDVDLTNREQAVHVLFSKFNKNPSERISVVLNSISDKDFWDFFKRYWVLGKSRIEDIKNLSLWDLFLCLGKQRRDIFQVYYKLRDIYPDSYVFSGVLSFVEKSCRLEEISVKNGLYLKLLKEFHYRYGKEIKRIIMHVYEMDSYSISAKEYRTFVLLYSLGRGDIL